MNGTTTLNNKNFNGTHDYCCEKCDYRFKVDHYNQMVKISRGAFKYCPNCGRVIVGYKINGIPLNESNEYFWAMGLI